VAVVFLGNIFGCDGPAVRDKHFKSVAFDRTQSICEVPDDDVLLFVFDLCHIEIDDSGVSGVILGSEVSVRDIWTASPTIESGIRKNSVQCFIEFVGQLVKCVESQCVLPTTHLICGFEFRMCQWVVGVAVAGFGFVVVLDFFRECVTGEDLADSLRAERDCMVEARELIIVIVGVVLHPLPVPLAVILEDVREAGKWTVVSMYRTAGVAVETHVPRRVLHVRCRVWVREVVASNIDGFGSML